MKVLVPENSLIWTPNGFCFPGDIEYGTEIFVLNSEKKLTPHPITEELEEPEKYLTETIFSSSHTSTFMLNYKTRLDDELIELSSLQINNPMPLIDANFIKDYELFHDKAAEDLSQKSPISPTAAKYLAQGALNENRQCVIFKKPTQEEAFELGRDIKSTLEKEFGGHASYLKTMSNYGRNYFRKGQSKNAYHEAGHMISFSSDKFYNIRKFFNLRADQIPKLIYTNGFYLFFTFLQNLLQAGHANHLNYFTRGPIGKKYLIFDIPWQSKLRKLIQNTAIFWDKYTLSIYQSKEQRALDEVKLEAKNIRESLQTILEIKKHKSNCYEIDIPSGSEIIIDNMIIKPFEISDTEKDELASSEGDVMDFDFAQLRKKIISEGGSVIPFRTIDEIKRMKKPFHIHVLGKFDRKGTPRSTSTRFGDTYVVTGFLVDDTGETKIRLWGEIANTIEDNNILELTDAYSKNGILNNSQGGKEKIHGNISDPIVP